MFVHREVDVALAGTTHGIAAHVAEQITGTGERSCIEVSVQAAFPAARFLRRLRRRTRSIVCAATRSPVENGSGAVRNAERRTRLPNADSGDLPAGEDPFANRGVVPSETPARDFVARVDHQSMGAIEV